MNFSRKKNIGALLLLLFLTVTSCHDVKKQKQLNLVKEMIGQADSIRQATDQINRADDDEIILNVSGVTAHIKKYYNPEDTISIEFAQKLENYKTILTGLKFVEENSEKLKTSIGKEKKDLLQLQSDIQKGNGDRSKYNEYIAFEKNKVRQLNVLLKNCVTTQTKCVDSYHQLHDEIKAFSEGF